MMKQIKIFSKKYHRRLMIEKIIDLLCLMIERTEAMILQYLSTVSTQILGAKYSSSQKGTKVSCRNSKFQVWGREIENKSRTSSVRSQGSATREKKEKVREVHSQW